MKIKRLLCFVLAIVTVLTCFVGCAGNSSEAGSKATVEDFQGSDVKVGVVTGSFSATFADELFPNGEIVEYNSFPDMSIAISQGKIDIAPADLSIFTVMCWDGINVSKLEETYITNDAGIVFKKGENAELREQLNEFLAKIKEDGTYDEMQAKWFGSSEPTEFLSMNSLTGTNGTIKVITCSELKPFNYVKNGEIVGYDTEMMIRFAQEYGYQLEITDVSFAAIIPGVASGKYDIGISGFSITEERAESVDFSDVYHREPIVYIVRNSEESESKTLSDFENASLGVVTGSLYGGYSREQFPEAEIKEFNNFADVLTALKQGKVDGTMLDRPNFNSVRRTDSRLGCIDVPAYDVEIGFGFQKNEGGYELQAQMNEFLDKLRTEGKIDEMIDKWYGETEPSENIPLDELKGNPETLKVSIDTTRKPFVYLYEGEPVGFEIEVLYLFCSEYGYDVVIDDVSFASGLAGLAGEKYDLVCGGLYMTPERKESVNFSDPYMYADVVLAYYEQGGVESFFASIGESFEKTFIREDRWKLIAEGVAMTLLISFFAVIGGTAFGFVLYLAARSANKNVSAAAKIFAKIYSKLISGTPTLVILMILFYVVFGSSDISGAVVAVIGFILTFGSFVYGQLELTVESVDKGQTEAAYALGYSRNQTFFRIVLPQAMKMFIPVYSSEIISLIKATSVVGYIAVNDLTKMGDIIRANTYEAFFPLIAVAVIYFIITWGVAELLNILKRKTEPKRRKNENILKGVVR